MRKSTLLLALLFFIFPLLGFQSYHKYYISVTDVEYVPKEKSIQIISRIFIDDFEHVLKERYDDSLLLGKRLESSKADFYIKKYLADKLQIDINSKESTLVFIGKKYDEHVLKCYLEIENVKEIQSLEVRNTVLFDVFKEQQNIIKTKINSQKKSFTLTQHKKSKLLEF